MRTVLNTGYAVREFAPYTVIFKQTHPHIPDILGDKPLLGEESVIHGRNRMRIIEPDLIVRPLTHGGSLRHITGSRFLSIKRSLREIEISSYLRSKNIPTPEILAVRYRKNGVFFSIEVITALVPESIDLLVFLEKNPGDSEELLIRAGRLVQNIHRLGVYHTDLHVKNILLDRDMEPWIIDLDNAYRFTTLPSLLRAKNLRRFIHSLKKWEKKGRITLSSGWEEAFMNGYTAPG